MPDITPSDHEAPPARNTPAPRSRRVGPSLLLWTATFLYAMPLLIVLGGNVVGPEHWWLTGFNLYMPQSLWLLPLIVLFPWYLWRARRWAWLPLGLLLITLIPVMGLSVHGVGGYAPSEKGWKLRVMTYNIKWASRDPEALKRNIADNKPDLLLMQDAGGDTMTRMGAFLHGWNVAAVDQYIIASRLPISDADIRWISTNDQSHRVLRCIVHLNGYDAVVYSCHLATPRFGLSAMRHPRAGLSLWKSNMNVRIQEAQRLAEHVHHESMPTILGGDLNAPAQSIVCKNLFEAGMTDAFSAAGTGYGYTYGTTTKVHRPYVRIDHIMTSFHWQVKACWVGSDAGSDHCPVFADLYLPKETE